jgi:starch synthase/alpha-amylase
VADGPFQRYFKEIVALHDLYDRVAVFNFNENLSHLAYGAADFILMPSSFEPCGLPQMIGSIYGALPVCHDTGGIHDTVTSLEVNNNTGNGFLFEIFDKDGLSWAIDRAMDFYRIHPHEKAKQIQRIMKDSVKKFHHNNTARQYIDLYEKMLQRPLINRNPRNRHLAAKKSFLPF